MKLHRVFVMLWLLSPFTDLAETVSIELMLVMGWSKIVS
jgi:hypothetical protein